MKKILFTLSITAGLFGCASNELSEQELALTQAQMERNTLEVHCPNGGCTIKYRDPRDQIALPQRTNGWDALVSASQSVERLLLGGAPFYLGVEAVRALRDTGDVITTNTSTSTDTRNTSTDTRTQTDNSVGDYSGEASGNEGRIDSPNSDSTHTPTVVTQPDPLVVE